MSESARSILKHLYKEGRMTEAQYQKIDRNLKEPQWVPYSERLPEEDGRFLVFLPDRNGTFMCADFLGGKWYPDDYECTSNHVIAWMPLPKPYEKEGESN